MKIELILIDLNTNGIFLIREKNKWVLPKEYYEENEPEYFSLIKKISEKLSVSKNQISIYNFYKAFKGIESESKLEIESKVYFGFLGKIKPKENIDEIRRLKNFEEYNLSNITHRIIDELIKDRYLQNENRKDFNWKL